MPRGKTKFYRCVKAVRRRGGAYDPKAVCGAMRARGELNPSFGGEHYSTVVRLPADTDQDERRANELTHKIRSQGLAATYVYKETRSGKAGYDLYTNASRSQVKRLAISLSNPGRKRYWVLVDDAHLLGTFATKKAADQYASKVKRQSPDVGRVSVKDSHRENPAGAAAEAFKRFHGREAREFVTVTKKIHRHGNLWSLGTLRMLKIRTERGQTVKLSGFKGAYLAANEQAFGDLSETGRANLTQLYVEGGDQSVDLKSFGIDPDRAHEVETLGKAIVIDYHTVKVHLGGEGGDAIYRHKFRTTREGDREVTLRVAKFPDVIYRVLDQQLEFSGGSYEIRAEGIDK